MITRKGYVAVSPDGTFYRVDVHHTHLSTRAVWSAVNNIDEAELFSYPHARSRVHGTVYDEPPGLRFVPVTKRSETSLEGFGT